MPKIDERIASQLRKDFPQVPEPFLDADTLTDRERELFSSFQASLQGKLGPIGRLYHNLIAAPSCDLVSLYILPVVNIPDKDGRPRYDALIRIYSATSTAASFLLKDTLSLVSGKPPAFNTVVEIPGSRGACSAIFTQHEFKNEVSPKLAS